MVETSLSPAEALIAPWRRATLVAAGIAVVELTLVVALAVTLLTREDGASRSAATRVAATTGKPKPATVLPRAKTQVLILNGNGRTGAASAQADVVRSLRYRVAGVGNATRLDHGRSTVLYLAGRDREARRLAKELGITLVGPLDGMSRKTLRGAHVAVILGR